MANTFLLQHLRLETVQTRHIGGALLSPCLAHIHISLLWSPVYAFSLIQCRHIEGLYFLLGANGVFIETSTMS